MANADRWGVSGSARMIADDNTTNFNGDYSVIPKIARLKPPDTEIWILYHNSVQIEDGGIGTGKYGGITSLTNGISITSKKNGVYRDVTRGVTIKTTAQWLDIFQQGQIFNFGAGDDFWSAFINIPLGAFILDGKQGDELFFTLNDDFRGITRHTFGANILVKKQ